MEQDPSNPPVPFDPDLRVFAVGAERAAWLAALIQTAREDLRPRDFVERHLVDELAINKWRLLRIYGMEKAVYQHQQASYRPKAAGPPNDDLYHLACTHSPDHDAVILAALGRLEARFHRQFCAALKMLLALRKLNPAPQLVLSAYSSSQQEAGTRQNPPQPTESLCQSLSESSSDQATTTSPNKSKPNSSQ